jgi:hypothetical protein
MMNASNVIRMAIGIGTANSFTIKELFYKLCQQTCDMVCGRPAPYIDVFTLSRRCLRVGGPCDLSNGPQTVDSLIHLSHYSGTLDKSEFDTNVPSFALIKGTYGELEVGFGIGCSSDKVRCCDYERALSFLATKEASRNDLDFRWTRQNQDLASRAPPRYHRYWKLTAVFAPFLDFQDQSAQYGAFCEKCTQIEADYRQLKSLWNWHIWDNSMLPNLTSMAFGTADWLAEHNKTGHSH